MKRVVVAGGPGSGKTLLARRLAAALNASHVELDELWWQPGWAHRSVAEFQDAVRERLDAAPVWVVDGNYLEVGMAAVWQAADVLVWLDLPRRVGFARAVRRSVRRLFRREPLWNGNRETLGVLAPPSLLRLWRRWPSYGAKIEAELATSRFPHLDVVRLRRRSDVDRWLASITGA